MNELFNSPYKNNITLNHENNKFQNGIALNLPLL